ncbi:DUF3618 domain-containing protein [Actinomadura luteofluorescens]|uniref:DUF3618 domain-containing protein n=1 Tax=Actinomadura luteofluorescens TaxID=46163 RepID=A0A7Y9JMN6_9ACTN|nr:DUF3618 domain-containing protein [Actinomadura luteofluorescens]NYD52779.1 hypothetical protein [Actinomadura luteofluorescens]
MTMQGKHGAEAGTEELRQEVDRARHELGETVEQLAAKADVKAMARQKVEQARGRARDAAVSAREMAGSEQGKARARQGGVVIVSAGALALGAVWLRRRRTSRTTPRDVLRDVSRMRRGRGRRAPVQVRMRTGQKRAVTVRRTGRR